MDMIFCTPINTHLLMVKRFALWFLVAISLLGCSQQSSSLEKEFSTLFPLTDMNESLQLAVDSDKTSFKSYEEIPLTISNKSPYPLSFDINSHIKLLGSPDHLQWVDVKNGITYSGTLVLSPSGTMLLDYAITVVQPLLDQSGFIIEKDQAVLRIVIVGEIMDTGEKVGAVVDVVLKP